MDDDFGGQRDALGLIMDNAAPVVVILLATLVQALIVLRALGWM